MVLLLNNAEVEKLFDIEQSLSVLEQAYKDLSAGRAINRPRSHTFTPTAQSGTFHLFKTIEGGSGGLGVFALRINSELWRAPTAASPRIMKIPAVADGRYTEFILLFSVESGELLAILPDGYIQKMRVALTHALAAKYMARADAKVLGLFGSGWQAGAQAVVQSRARDLRKVKVYSPSVEHRQHFVERLRSVINADVEAASGPEEVMKGSDIVIAATDSRTPVIRHPWLEPGMHLSSVRAWTEVEADALNRCHRIFVHNKTRSLDYLCGDAVPRQLVTADGPRLQTENCPELAAVVGGRVPGRADAQEITLFVDGNEAGGPGLGIQFASVGSVVYRRALATGVGQQLPLDWFLDREDHPYLENSGGRS